MLNIAQQCIALSKTLNAKFTLNGSSIDYDHVFSDTGLLPAFAKRANELCELCLGYDIGASFDSEERSFLGVRVVFDDVTPNVLRLLCFADILIELVHAAPSSEVVPLDELLYD